MQKTMYWFIGALVVAVIVIVIALALRGYRQSPVSVNDNSLESPVVIPEVTQTPIATDSPTTPSTTQAVTIGDAGFSPASLTVKKGTSVQFVNNSTKASFVASNPHPTHTDLAEFQSGNFDSNESYTFKFDKVGTWGYHNHLNPGQRGTIVVTE